jgi:hypothetical protein
MNCSEHAHTLFDKSTYHYRDARKLVHNGLLQLSHTFSECLSVYGAKHQRPVHAQLHVLD